MSNLISTISINHTIAKLHINKKEQSHFHQPHHFKVAYQKANEKSHFHLDIRMTLESTTHRGAHRLGAMVADDVRGVGGQCCSVESIREQEGDATRWTPMAVEGAWAEQEWPVLGGG
jgi:hypothetical protein